MSEPAADPRAALEQQEPVTAEALLIADFILALDKDKRQLNLERAFAAIERFKAALRSRETAPSAAPPMLGLSSEAIDAMNAEDYQKACHLLIWKIDSLYKERKAGETAPQQAPALSEQEFRRELLDKFSVLEGPHGSPDIHRAIVRQQCLDFLADRYREALSAGSATAPAPALDPCWTIRADDHFGKAVIAITKAEYLAVLEFLDQSQAPAPAQEETTTPARPIAETDGLECFGTCGENDDICSRQCARPLNHDGRHACKNHV